MSNVVFAGLETWPMLARLTLLLAGLLLAHRALRSSPAAARHLVLACGLGAAILLPLLAAALPEWRIPLHILPAARLQAASLPLAPPALEPHDGLAAEAWTASRGTGPAWTAAPSRPEPAAVSSENSAAAPRRLSWSPAGLSWPGLLWALGFLLLAGRFAWGWSRMSRLVSRAVPLQDRRIWQRIEQQRRQLGLSCWPAVVVSEELQIPAAWGIASPTLVLPAEMLRWSDERVRMVLLHELSHVRRRDGLSLVVGKLAMALYWFHPLAWWAERQAREDSERACDDLVLTSGERASDYAEHLLEIAGAGRAPAAAALAFARPGLEGRLQAILCPSQRRTFPRMAQLVLAIGLVVCAVSLSTGGVVALPSATAQQSASSTEQAEPEVPALAVQGAVLSHGAPSSRIMLAQGSRRDSSGERAYREAMERHREERFAEAIELFELAIERGYRVAGSTYNIACGQARLGRTGDALDSLDRARDEGFDGSRYLYEDSDLDSLRGEIRFQKMLEALPGSGRGLDRRDLALDTYQEMLEQRSEDGSAWYRVGSDLLSLREFDKAIDALERAEQQLGPRGSSALYNLACAHSLRGNSDKAIELLERAVLAGFDNSERLRNDSDLDPLREGDAFERIADLHATLSTSEYQAGSRWSASPYAKRRWTQEIEQFRQVTRDHPEIGRAWFNLGYALHGATDHAEARAAFQRAIELGFRPATSMFNVACTLAMEKDTQGALDWLERAVEAGFRSGAMLHDDDLNGVRDDPRFEQILERAAELSPDDEQRWRWKQRERKSGWI